MVSSADDLALWKDFPKGLGVLLCDEDSESAADTKIKLEAMNYIVHAYCKEEALEAVLRKAENYHIAIVEVTADNSHDSFKFLEMVDIPTIVISKVHCLNTVMKCIELGAAEFLQKPLSQEKLENIWQHVVHKAFNAGGYVTSRSLKPIKETVKSLPKFQSQTSELKFEIPSQILEMEQAHEAGNVNENVKFSAPSTPQLIKGGRYKGNESIQYEFIDNSLNNITCPVNSDEVYLPSKPEEITADEELISVEGSKVDECSSTKEVSLNAESQDSDSESRKKKSFVHGSSCLNSRKGNRRKIKIDWTQDLHREFVQAVEKLGIDQAIPSKILELMKVEGLTRHNVASHLQKFRMHRRHILPKEDDIRWYRDSSQNGCIKKTNMAFSPYPSNYAIAASQVYPMWPHQTYQLPNVQMWRYSGIPIWHPPDNWQSMNPEIHADAWGFPILPHYSYGQHYMPPQGPSMINNRLDASVTVDGGILSKSSYDACPAKEVIDDVLKEAMSKPWLPLPLGLKPPSPEKIIAELHFQGIQTIPPLPRLSRS